MLKPGTGQARRVGLQYILVRTHSLPGPTLPSLRAYSFLSPVVSGTLQL